MFLLALCIFHGIDAYLTSVGVGKIGVSHEGNQILRWMMWQFGTDNALMITKGAAIAVLAIVTFLARGLRSTARVMWFLGAILLLAAIGPWAVLLWFNA